jgi:hypothetical protein
MDGRIGWMSGWMDGRTYGWDGWMNDVGMAVFSCYCWPFVGRLSGPTTRGEMVVVSLFFHFCTVATILASIPRQIQTDFALSGETFVQHH